MKPIVALYARVSTPLQEQEATIDSQVAALETFARQHAYELDPTLYFLDQAVSGARLARPALDRLRDVACDGRFSLLLCLSPDRLARQLVHQQLLLDELRRHQVSVQFVNQPALDDSPQQRLLRGVQGLFAEYEREVLTDRLRRGRLHQLRRGKRLPWPAPYGYTYLPLASEGGGSWDVQPAEAQVVRAIFTWYTEEQLSISAIARRLNEQQIPTRAGKRWFQSSVSVVLRQSAYRGVTYYNRSETNSDGIGEPRQLGRGVRRHPQSTRRPPHEWIELPCPALLSSEQWERAQERRMTNQRFADRNNRTNHFLLRGLLVCDVCGHTLTGRHAAGRYGYYACLYGGVNRPPELPAHSRTVALEEAEQRVWEVVAGLLRHPERLKEAWHASIEEVTGHDPTRAAQRGLRQLEHQWQRLVDAYQEGLLDKADLAQRKQTIDRERARLEQEVVHHQQAVQHAQVRAQLLQDFAKWSERMQQVLDQPTFELKQEILRLLVDHILVEENTLVIHHILPKEEICRLSKEPN